VRGARRCRGALHGGRRACVACPTLTLPIYPDRARRAQGSVGEVERFLEGQGLNARALVDGAARARGAAGDALTTARPTLDSTVSTLRATDPVVLAQWAGIAAGVYYLARAPLRRTNLMRPVRGRRSRGERPHACMHAAHGCTPSPQHALLLRAVPIGARAAAHGRRLQSLSARSPCLPADSLTV